MGLMKMKVRTATETLRRAGRNSEYLFDGEGLADRLVRDKTYALNLAALRMAQLKQDGWSDKGAYLAYSMSCRAQEAVWRHPQSVAKNSVWRERSARYDAYMRFLSR
jgi:hypothetical protein